MLKHEWRRRRRRNHVTGAQTPGKDKMRNSKAEPDNAVIVFQESVRHAQLLNKRASSRREPPLPPPHPPDTASWGATIVEQTIVDCGR